MYTLTKFVRDAKVGMSLELIERFGKTGDEILERLRGARRITHITNYKMELTNTQGQVSHMIFKSAKLVGYDGEYLMIYDPVRRDPTEEEQKVLDKINSIDSYFLKKDYAKSSPCPWMNPYGDKVIKGKKYIQHENKVLDRSMRGDMILKYRILKG